MSTFCISRVEFGKANFKMLSLMNNGYEDDVLVPTFINGDCDENLSLAYWLYMAETSQPDGLLLDIGAYAGLFSLLAAKANPRIKIAALEAASATFGRLIDNIRHNGLFTNICAANYAAWSTTCSLRFGHRYGIYNMCPGDSAVADKEVDHTEDVFAISLDELINETQNYPGPLGSNSLGIKGYKNIVGLKIDVEGAELHVLLGAKGLIDKYKPAIICELLNQGAVESIGDVLLELNYTIVPIEKERNFILCHRDKLDEFLEGFRIWSSNYQSPLRLRAWRHLMLET